MGIFGTGKGPARAILARQRKTIKSSKKLNSVTLVTMLETIIELEFRITLPLAMQIIPATIQVIMVDTSIVTIIELGLVITIVIEILTILVKDPVTIPELSTVITQDRF